MAEGTENPNLTPANSPEENQGEEILDIPEVTNEGKQETNPSNSKWWENASPEFRRAAEQCDILPPVQDRGISAAESSKAQATQEKIAEIKKELGNEFTDDIEDPSTTIGQAILKDWDDLPREIQDDIFKKNVNNYLVWKRERLSGTPPAKIGQEISTGSPESTPAPELTPAPERPSGQSDARKIINEIGADQQAREAAAREKLEKAYDAANPPKFTLDHPALDTSNTIPTEDRTFWDAPGSWIRGLWYKITSPRVWRERITEKEHNRSLAEIGDAVKLANLERNKTIGSRQWFETPLGAKWYSMPLGISTLTAPLRGWWYGLIYPKALIEKHLYGNRGENPIRFDKEVAENVEWQKTKQRRPELAKNMEDIAKAAADKYKAGYEAGLQGVAEYDAKQREKSEKPAEQQPTKQLIYLPEITSEIDDSSQIVEMGDDNYTIDLQTVKNYIEKFGAVGAFKNLSRELQSTLEKTLKKQYILNESQTDVIHEKVLEIAGNVIKEAYNKYDLYNKS